MRPGSRRRGETARGPRALVALVAALVASLVWIEMPVAPLTASVPAPHRGALSDGLDWLRTRGGHIVDSRGRTVLLRGFNTSTLLESTVLRSPLDGTDASMMAADGFDVVRLAISWGRLEPQRGAWDESYLDEIASMVSMLTAHHLYVILDMHFLDWSAGFGGSGAPLWARLPVLPDLHIAWLGDWQRHLSPAANGAITYFWLSPDWQSDFLLAWQHVAARFRDDSGVAGYDLFNEPHALPLPPVRFEKDMMWPLYARTIDAIGAVDPNHLFIAEGQLLGDFGTTVVPLSAPDLVYSPHEYTGSLVPPTFDGNPRPLDAHVAQVAAEARQVPAALWVGEWGMAADQARSMQWVDDAVAAFSAAGAGWAWWQWREDSSWGVRDSAGHTDTTLLRHLAVPYLAAAPAGSGAASILPDGSLRFTVEPGASAPIVVAWPLESRARLPTVRATCALTTAWDAQSAQLTVRVSALDSVCSVSVA
ncbi:MAG: glycoside hydrolase family 5 protein [Candidatus Dormibacteria bacterium]